VQAQKKASGIICVGLLKETFANYYTCFNNINIVKRHLFPDLFMDFI